MNVAEMIAQALKADRDAVQAERGEFTAEEKAAALGQFLDPSSYYENTRPDIQIVLPTEASHQVVIPMDPAVQIVKREVEAVGDEDPLARDVLNVLKELESTPIVAAPEKVAPRKRAKKAEQKPATE